uniref:Protein YIPF5 homolog n=1 Tax=Piliocolobus tephrosceles TaxID=591936 RepID=A0A8C9GSI0_9PRIM
MNYYNQKIINRGSNRNDVDDINNLHGENNFNNIHINKKKIYDNNYNRPINLIPSAPFENKFNYNYPINEKNLGFANNNNNKNNIVATNPFVNNLNINDINKTNEKTNEQNSQDDEEEELPLLEELGINFDLISKRMKSVFMIYKIDDALFENSDLSGPLIIVLSLGFILLLAGKASFSFIYLIGIVSSLSIYLLLNMMSQNATLDLYRTISMLGYALLPLVILSMISIIINLR